MGTKRQGERYVIWRVTVPESVAVKIELALMDPVRGKPVYGARSQLITELLVNMLANTKEPT